MKNLKLAKRYHIPGKIIKNAEPTPERFQIYKEFDKYQRENYTISHMKCLCGNNDQYLISKVDREGFEYHLEICRTCGLIKAKNYWDEKNVKDYYTNWYRKKYGGEEDPVIFYNNQTKTSKRVWDFVNEYTSRLKTPYTIVDIGGAAGGVLDSFKSDNDCHLFDYNKKLLNHAKTMGINTIEGGIDKLHLIEQKPDLVILSHVLEHFTNVHKELETLIKHLKFGSLVYIELPGIDSLNEGRRFYDFLADIHMAHVFYFSRGVLNNLMERKGFRCLKSVTEISALYEYTGQIGALKNYHNHVCSLINSAEIKRKLGLFYIKKYIGNILPKYLKEQLKRLL